MYHVVFTILIKWYIQFGYGHTARVHPDTELNAFYVHTKVSLSEGAPLFLPLHPQSLSPCFSLRDSLFLSAPAVDFSSGQSGHSI